MKGTYVLKQAGEIVAVCPNLITTVGKQELLRFLAGQRGRLAGSIGLGHGSTPPTLQDSQLVLESVRLDIGVSSPDFINNQVIYKGTLPQNTVGTYYELGIWSSNSLATAPLEPLLSFVNEREDWSVGTHLADNARIGLESLLVSATTNTTASTVNLNFAQDFSRFLVRDTFYLSFFTPDQNTQRIRLRLRGETPTNYFQYEFSTVQRGYNVAKFSVSDLTKVGIIDLSQVRSVELIVVANVTDVAAGATGGTDSATGNVYTTPLGYTGTRVYFDGLSHQPARSDNDVLISRALIPGAIKTAAAPMDVEYYLELNI